MLDVVVEGDCANVVGKLKSDGMDLSPLGNFTDVFRQLFTIRCGHIAMHRSQNIVADTLANFAYSISSNVFGLGRS